MGSHSKRSPSKISRIIRCPGSVEFIKYLTQRNVIPEEEQTQYTSEGTMLHNQIELRINDKPYSEELNAEQEDAIDKGINFLEELREKHGLTWVQTEVPVDLTGYGIKDAGGTADIKAGRHFESLHILDWKFGQGVPVYVEKNEQLMDYLLGAGENLEKLKAYKELWIHLAQPRLDYFGSYKCSIDELMGLVNAIKNSIGNYDIVAGETQCFWCRAKVHCAEYQAMADKAASQIFDIHAKMSANKHDFKDSMKVLKLEPFLKKVIKAVKDELAGMSNEALARIDLKRVAGRSNRSFVSEEQVVKYLVENYDDIEEIYEAPKLKSPAKLEKAIKGLKKDPEFKKLVIKPLGKPTIVSADDKRPEYKSDAASSFSHLKKED